MSSSSCFDVTQIADLSKENLGAITLTPNESNILLWRATLPGPAGSPYEGGVFEVDIKVPDDYPFVHPYLQTKMTAHSTCLDSHHLICTLSQRFIIVTLPVQEQYVRQLPPVIYMPVD